LEPGSELRGSLPATRAATQVPRENPPAACLLSEAGDSDKWSNRDAGVKQRSGFLFPPGIASDITIRKMHMQNSCSLTIMH